MGCGKSTLGRNLAKDMNYPFFDLDVMIEKQENKSIQTLFNQIGESAFRIIESDILRKTVFPENAVISTGGGTPCYNNNINYLNMLGFTIYLRMTADLLTERLHATENKRPLLPLHNKPEMYQMVNEMLIKREPFYTQAKLVVEGISISSGDIQRLVELNA